MPPFTSHPDRPLPADRTTRGIARELYDTRPRDTSRRMDSGALAGLVADHRLTMDDAPETTVDLVLTCPREASTL